jgi:hypothetical protein
MQYNKALRSPGKLMLQLPYQSIELGKSLLRVIAAVAKCHQSTAYD